MKKRYCYMIAILSFLIVFALCGCKNASSDDKCNAVRDSDLEVNSEQALIEPGEDILIQFASDDYTSFVKKWDEIGDVSEEVYNNAAGVYVYRDPDENYSSFPVYAKCIDGGVMDVSDIDWEDFYLSGNIQQVNNNGRCAYYILYSEEGENLGTGFLKLTIKQYGTKRELANSETYDIFNGMFDFYPAEGVTLKEYQVALTVPMDDETYRILEERFSSIEESEAPFVSHEFHEEILDNGYYWRGVDLSSKIDSPVRTEPWVVINAVEGSSKINNIDFSIRKLILKKGMKKISSARDVCVLSCEFKNHKLL